jgi:hypothetical protein
MYEAGHVFLARIGKTTLRPGGIEATEWLIDQAAITQETKVLEVACNRGRTMIQLAQRFGCAVTGVDLDENALQNAKANIEKNNLQDKLTLIHGDATALPFEDNSFDVIINEAMLTMLVGDRKDKALKEYFRVLKPGGRVVTQDVFFTVKDAALQKELRMGLSKTINVNVEPLDAEGWKSLFFRNGFTVTQKCGMMTLLSPRGLLRDEGLRNTLHIIRCALKKENRTMFSKMYRYFNGHKYELGYICNAGVKSAAV